MSALGPGAIIDNTLSLKRSCVALCRSSQIGPLTAVTYPCLSGKSHPDFTSYPLLK